MGLINTDFPAPYPKPLSGGLSEGVYNCFPMYTSAPLLYIMVNPGTRGENKGNIIIRDKEGVSVDVSQPGLKNIMYTLSEIGAFLPFALMFEGQIVYLDEEPVLRISDVHTVDSFMGISGNKQYKYRLKTLAEIVMNALNLGKGGVINEHVTLSHMYSIAFTTEGINQQVLKCMSESNNMQVRGFYLRNENEFHKPFDQGKGFIEMDVVDALSRVEEG